MRKTNLILFTLTISILFFGCSKNDDQIDNKFNGSLNSIKELIGEEVYQELNNLGFNFNPGNNPPNIENTYFVSPQKKVSSTVPNDNLGIIDDITVTFFNQNNSDLTIDFSFLNGIETGSGQGTFITGSGNDFSIILFVNITINDAMGETIKTISGTKTDEGIINWQSTTFMVDNQGNDNTLIPNNTSRMFIDLDEFSPIQ